MRRAILLTSWLVFALGATTPAGGPGAAQQGTAAPTVPAELRATAHPALPATAAQYWLVPAASWRPGTAAARAAAADLARAAALVGENKAAQALPLIRTRALEATPLRDHALYIRGLAELQLKRPADARRTFGLVRAAQPPGALIERATLREAEAAEALGADADAVALYESLSAPQVVGADDVLLRLGRAATRAGDSRRARAAWERLYFEYAATEGGAAAAAALASPAPGQAPAPPRVEAELVRAERLFAARRYALAYDGFERVLPQATGDQRELALLRLAACDYFLKRHRAAVNRLRPILSTASRRAEALFFYLSATRELGNHDQYVDLARQLVTAYPTSSWAEDTLNNLASHYLIVNEDALADEVFRETLWRFPSGRFAARAAWKVGWWAFKHGRDAEAAVVFERGAATFPRSDYRPPWLYWAGRARERTGDAGQARERFELAVIDYANSYYGRLAAGRLKALRAGVSPASSSARRWQPAAPAAEPAVPTTELIGWLIHAGLDTAALDEVSYAGRAWGRSAALDATRAYVLNRMGQLRPAISVMRQTYPHFLAAGGESLPTDIQRVIFPLDHWPLIRQHAAAHKLDPCLVAALVAQESTFDPQARSSANAIGLMQVLPSTGRQWANKLGIRGFSARSLTNPVVNVRIGTAYFADLVKRFGSEYLALASYNAGAHRVNRWMSERPGLPREEFIDDIPFPETQNYVKRILGTAEDYRRLYGTDARQ